MVGKRRYVIESFAGAGARSTGPAAKRCSPTERALARLQIRTTAAPGSSFQPRATAAANVRHALYRGRARHSTNAFGSSVSGAAGRTVDTVRVGTKYALGGNRRRGRTGHDRRRQAEGEGSGADRGTICGARVWADASGRGFAPARLSCGAGMDSVRDGIFLGSRMAVMERPAHGGARVRRRKRVDDRTRSTEDADSGCRAAGSGAAATGSGQSFPGHVGSAPRGRPQGRHGVRCVRNERCPDGRFAVVDRSRAVAWSLLATGRASTKTMVAMRRATGRRDSWARWPARKGRQPEVPAGGAVRGGDIAVLRAARMAGTRAHAENYSKSVCWGEVGPCRAGSWGAVLLAIAVDIASKAVNAGAAHAREHRARRAPALPLAVTQRFDIKKVFSLSGNSSPTCRPPEAAHAVRRFCSR